MGVAQADNNVSQKLSDVAAQVFSPREVHSPSHLLDVYPPCVKVRPAVLPGMRG